MRSHTPEPPFFANTADGNRCYQAAIRMVVQSFRPDRDYSWSELDRITGRIEDGGTWPLAGTVWLHEQGYEVLYVEPMDNRRFAREGANYVREFYGSDDLADPRTDYAREQANARRLVERVPFEVRVPTIDDLRTRLDENYLLICLVNSRALNGQSGHRGHFVVVKGCDDDALVIHDPGPPAQSNRRVPLDEFEAAWAFPDERAKNFVAVRDSGSRR